ncbi:hypothetical protein CcaCcLH18_04937 [Colletotrichum camelliae]|nr:hypothetical protein CcaCcLH18_04937 [Colletotrichum camelliae]
MDVMWEGMLPWRREQATWEPLCTHTAFLEKHPPQSSSVVVVCCRRRLLSSSSVVVVVSIIVVSVVVISVVVVSVVISAVIPVKAVIASASFAGRRNKTHLAADIETFEAICGQHPLKFANNTYEVLMAKQPPTVDFFRTLPKPNKTSPVWGVYTILLEKVDHPAKLYVGSAMPGCCGWCAMPKPGQAPLARLRVVADKATLAFVFFAGTPCQMDVLWETMLSWTRDEVAWEPLCTHTAFLKKPFGDLSMSEEELETYNAKRRARALAQMKVNSRAFGEREKATSLEAYRARKRTEKLAWTNNNRDRVHQHAKTTRTNAKNSQKWRCHEIRNGTLRDGILLD